MKRIWRKIRNYIRALLAADTGRRGADDSSTPAASGTVPDGGTGSTAATADGVDFSLLRWRWGGFQGGRAVLSDCRIAALKVTPNGLSYKWTVGGCEDLDRACSHDKPVCTCALFCRIDGKWIGGKFDHISTDRRTRDFENIEGRYGGWEPESLSKATAFAFVILDDGARRRTNVILQEGGAR